MITLPLWYRLLIVPLILLFVPPCLLWLELQRDAEPPLWLVKAARITIYPCYALMAFALIYLFFLPRT